MDIKTCCDLTTELIFSSHLQSDLTVFCPTNEIEIASIVQNTHTHNIKSYYNITHTYMYLIQYNIIAYHITRT